MTVESSFQSEDIFAKAIERVEAGEPIDVVLASVPEEIRAELRDLLLLFTATHHLQRAPVPQPPAPRRAERKAAFLAAAAQMKAETAVPAVAPTVTPTVTPVAAKTAPQMPKRLTIADWLRDFGDHVQTAFRGPNLGFAPLVMLLLAVWLGAFGFVSAAEAAGVGDFAYPVRQWMRYQELSLSSEKARGVIYNEIKDEILIDLVKAATELREEEKVSGAKVARISKELLVFEGIEDGYLLIGPLRVLMQYQPNPNLNEFIDMTISAMPGAKDQVELTFQIIPSADPNATLPFVVQGISLQVPDRQLVIGPTPTGESTVMTGIPVAATATVTASATPCQVVRPAGWVPYAVRSGDSLSAIAQRTGVTIATLQQVNCLGNPNSIRAGSNLFAPAMQQVNTPTATQPPLAGTLTAISTTTVTPTVTIVTTVTPTVTIVTTVTPTVTMTTSTTPTSTIVSTVTPTVTIVTSATPTATVIASVTPTVAPTATITLVATGSPTAAVTAEATPSATVIVSVTPTDTLPSATSTPTAEQPPLPSATPTPTMTPMDDATETVTAVATPATDTPVAPTLAASLTPETEATAETTATTIGGGSGAGSPATETPTAEDTPIPETLTDAATATREATAVNTTQPQRPASTPTAPPPTVAPTVAVAPTATDTPIPQNHSPLSGG